MDEHTRIWGEPLSDWERWIIEARCADPTNRDTGKWMRHLLTCYDALAVRAAELERERDEARAARDLLVEVNDELLGRLQRAEAVLRDIAEGCWNTGSRTLDVPAPPYRDAREYARVYFDLTPGSVKGAS